MDTSPESFPRENMPVYQEVNTWIYLLIDHARFMRNSFDTTEERLFQEANQFSQRFVRLVETDKNEILQEEQYLHELQNTVQDFIAFKRRVTRGIENCRILSILPAALIDHIMKEAIFFSGILARIKNEPRLNWGNIGLPDRRRASTVPQAYIPRLPNELENIAWEELLFWLEIQFEHAEVLSLYFRPQQRSLRRDTIRWGRRIRRLYDDVLSAFESSRIDPERFINPALNLMENWAEFLRNLFRRLENCEIPGEQMNIWPRVVNHMWRETIYFIQVLQVLAEII